MDVGGVLGRRLDLSAAGDFGRELLHCQICQSRVARSGNVDRRVIDGALGAHRAAAADLEGQIGLIDVLHDEVARAGEVDPAEGTSGQGDLDVPEAAEAMTVERYPAVTNPDMSDDVGRSAHDDVAAVTAAVAHAAWQGDVDCVATLPRQTALQLFRVALAVVVAARLGKEDAAIEHAVQVTAANNISKSQRGEADAEAADRNPAQGLNHVRLRHPL